MKSAFLLTLAALLIIGVAECAVSENSGTNVANGLRICYNTTEFVERDYRLPSTINTLIDLIRLAEDGAPDVDARRLVLQLLHRFRQDGIVKASTVVNSNVLAYSPNGYQHGKNKILLRQLVPGDGYLFRNNSLTTVEQCGLHFMISNTIEDKVRGDESQVCKRSGQYTQRMPRDAETFDEDKRSKDREDLSPAVERFAPKFANHDEETSECPVESGIVYTRWGAVQAGSMLAGIAAGYEPLEVSEFRVDNRYGTTLSGDLAEVAFNEGILKNAFTIGARGGWNSTLSPHWYFVDSQKPVYFTDPELRADMDGLIMGMKVKEWDARYRTLKLSQIIDMYYSNRGFASSKYKACNRNKEITEFAPNDILIEKTKAFAKLYNKYTHFDVSPSDEEIDTYVKGAIDAYGNSITSIADVKCDEDDLDRTATNLIIVLDTTWTFENIYPSLSYLLDNLDINKYESNYTVINAKNGQILVNSSTSLSKFHQQYNKSIHERQGSERGFDVYKFMDIVEDIHRNRAEADKTSSKLSGKSSTVLLVPSTTDAQAGSYLQQRYTSVFDQYYPDTHFIVLGTGSRDVYNNFVRNPAKDIFILPNIISRDSDVMIMDNLNELVKRLREAPRKIINPRCGAAMNGDASSNSMELYIEPGTRNFYKVARNYLGGDGTKTIKIKGQNGGNITVCTSRTDPRPTQNCKQLGLGEESFDLTGDGTDPFHFTLVAGHTTDSSNVRCSDNGCRFPDTLKVSVNIEGFSCSPSAGHQMTSSLFVIIAFIGAYFIKLY